MCLASGNKTGSLLAAIWRLGVHKGAGEAAPPWILDQSLSRRAFFVNSYQLLQSLPLAAALKKGHFNANVAKEIQFLLQNLLKITVMSLSCHSRVTDMSLTRVLKCQADFLYAYWKVL